MRWPFKPPHMTLKPSKRNTKNNKTKKNKKGQKREKKTRKNKKYSKMSFSVISENFPLFWVGVQNFPFLTTWPKKRAPKKHYKNRGFSQLFFGKHICVTKRPFLDQKNLHSQIPIIIFFCLFSSLSTTENTKKCWNPYFYSVLANQKKIIFKFHT